jgi:hypothetical protein
MNGINQNDNRVHMANICMKISKYFLWIPVFPALFLATSENVAIKILGIQHTLPALLLMIGLLSYPVVYAVSFALAPKYNEIHRYNVSIAVSLSPLVSLLLALAGYLNMPR